MRALGVVRTPRRLDDQALGRRLAAAATAAVLLLGLVAACTPAEAHQVPRPGAPALLPTAPAPAITLAPAELARLASSPTGATPTPPAVPR